MEDEYQDAHQHPDQHSGWTPDEQTCPITGQVLVDEAGATLPF